MSSHESQHLGIREKIAKKAWEDEAFKKELLSGNAKQALEREFKLVVPGDIKITVLQETEDQFYLVLPMDPKADKHGPHHGGKVGAPW